jgi:hypothetical protein
MVGCPHLARFSRDVGYRQPPPQSWCGPHNSVRVPHVRTSVARISYYAALATTAYAAFSQRKPHGLAQRHHARQEIRDTWAENDGRSPPQPFVPISTGARRFSSPDTHTPSLALPLLPVPEFSGCTTSGFCASLTSIPQTTSRLPPAPETDSLPTHADGCKGRDNGLREHKGWSASPVPEQARPRSPKSDPPCES